MSFDRRSGNDDGFIRFDTSSLAIAIGAMLVFDRSNHVVIKATSSTSVEDLAGIAVEAIAATDTSVLCQKVQENDEFIASTTNNSNSAHNYQRMVLTDESTVNNTGSDSTSDAAYIMQLYPVGAAADKKIRCRIVRVQDRA